MFYDNPDLAFNIINVFFVERGAVEGLSERARSHTSLAYRIKGECEFTCNSQAYCAGAESVTYIPAYRDFVRSSTDEKLIILHLNVYGEEKNAIETVNDCREAEPLFRKLLSVWEGNTAGAYNPAMQILYEIFELLNGKNEGKPATVPEIIRPGVMLLHNNYKNPSFRLSCLAEACYISQVHFRKLFGRHYGKSPKQMLDDLRFHRVCRLLSSGYYSQKEASAMSGFSDVKYFRTAFKKKYGITPAEYISKAKQ